MDINPLNNITISSTIIDGDSYNVLDYDDYRNSKSLWEASNLAVKRNYNGDTMVLPFRGNYNDKASQPGIYNAGSLDIVILPDEKEKSKYTNIPIISISSNDDIKSIIEKEKVLSKLAEPWITNPDNITCINIKDDDEPSMKCLKEAINLKKCDLDKYASRFGDNYPNDKRQLKNNNVTLKIIKRFCDNLDMEAYLTIKDKSLDSPNPMGKSITISLSSGEFINNDEESSLFEEDD